MTLISLADCCRLLVIDPKTLHHWMRLSHLTVASHPDDARLKCLSAEHLEQLGAAHHRSVPLSGRGLVPADPLALGEPEPAKKLTDGPAQLRALTEHLEALQAQVTLLREDLTRLTHPVVSEPVPPPSPGTRPAKAPSRKPSQPSCMPAGSDDRRKQPHVLSRVEYVTQDTYAMISSEVGKLSFEPDSPDWFAWLWTLASFRFVGLHGYYTAYRGYGCSPGTSWWAFRQIHSHCRKVRIGTTELLTLEALELAASSLQALV